MPVKKQQTEPEQVPNSTEVTDDLESILAALKAPIDPARIKQRPGFFNKQTGQQTTLDYIEWFTAADILDEIYPAWTNTIDFRIIGDKAIAIVGITVCGVTRYGIGCGDASSEMGIKKAEHDGLKRAAVKFGLARELYHKEDDAIEQQPPVYGSGYTPQNFAQPNYPPPQQQGGNQFPQNQPYPPNVMASSANDQITQKQVNMLEAMGKRIGLDPYAECQAGLNVGLGALNKKAASAFIGHMQRLEAGQEQSYTITGSPLGGQQVVYDAGYQAPAYTEQPQQAPQPMAPQAPQPMAPQHQPAAPQPASAAQGRLAAPAQVQALRNIASGIGYAEADVATEYSGGRTTQLEGLSQAEAADAINKLQM